MLKYCCVLLVLCALAQTQAAKTKARAWARARAVLPISAEDVDEEPANEGRVFSIIRDSDRDHGHHDNRPIIIQPPHTPPYPQHPPYHSPYPAPFPYPVPNPQPQPPTIIRPIIRPPYPRPYPSPGWGGGFGGYGGLPFINITYAPVLPAASSGVDVPVIGKRQSDQQQLNGLADLSKQLLAQALAGQAQSSQLIYPQQRDAQKFYGQSADGQLFAINLDQQQQLQLEELDTVQKPKKTQYLVRRAQKSKKKSRKNKKETQLVFLTVEPEADLQQQSEIMEEVA